MVMIIKSLKRILSIIKSILWKIAYLSGFKCGKNTFFYPGCRVMVVNTGKLIIGKNCFFNHNCSITCLGEIKIGNDCIFGEGVKIYDHNHKFISSEELFRTQGYTKGKVRIGDNCWIGSNVIILEGVEIGRDVVIGAGTIVTKSVPSGTILYNKTVRIQRKIEGKTNENIISK